MSFALSLSRLRLAVALLCALLEFEPAVFPAASGTRTISGALRLDPDYAGIVIPPNIAPMNFAIEEKAAQYHVRVSAAVGQPIELRSRSPAIVIPPGPWRALLGDNVGGQLLVDVELVTAQGWQHRFETVTNMIARDAIDPYLVYRRLKPLYNYYQTLGIYQRHLESYTEEPLLENNQFGRGCLNCHTFLAHSPDHMALNIRRENKGNPMLLIMSNQVSRVAQTAGYLSWHPSGRLITFSANKLSLFFHTIGETRDVFDADSDLAIYRVDSNLVVKPPAIARRDRLETWPAWAPDGKHLYFASAPQPDRRRFRDVRYDLVRVSYDIDRNHWGEPETLVSAGQTHMSAAQPRVSPDGQFLVYCLSEYGNFPIYQPSSDLYMREISTGKTRRLEINSAAADTWHCWSSNGRWLVFSSKRRDGLFARPYFTFVDGAGNCSKPFLLPQRDPAWFDSCLDTFNVPELVSGRVRVAPSDLSRSIMRPVRVLEPGKAAAQETPLAHETEYQDAHSDNK